MRDQQPLVRVLREIRMEGKRGKTVAEMPNGICAALAARDPEIDAAFDCTPLATTASAIPICR